MMPFSGQVINHQPNGLRAEALALPVVMNGNIDPSVAIHRVRLLVELNETDQLPLVLDHQHGCFRVTVCHQLIDVMDVGWTPPAANALAGQQRLQRSLVAGTPWPGNEPPTLQLDPANVVDSHSGMVAPSRMGVPPIPGPRDRAGTVRFLAMEEASGPPGILVVGRGRIALAPDIASLDVGVSLDGPDLDSIHQAVATKLTAARTHLGSVGIDGPDITTSTLNVRSSRDHQTGRRVFHVASRLTAILRDVGTAGAVVNGLFREVGEGLEMNGLSFDVEDRRTSHRDALALAFDDARANALVLAERAAVRLGDVLAVSEHGASGVHTAPMNRGMFAMSSAAEMPVEAGDLLIETAVEVRFAIER